MVGKSEILMCLTSPTLRYTEALMHRVILTHRVALSFPKDMAKKIKAKVKLNIPAGKATPAPPIGPALGQHGVAIMDFCKAYNERTKDMGEVIVPAVITIYEDRSFDFVVKTPPAAVLLKKAAGIEKGSKTAGREKVGQVSRQQLQEIAKEKMKDLNAGSLEAAVKIIAGTAKSMGLEIT